MVLISPADTATEGDVETQVVLASCQQSALSQRRRCIGASQKSIQ